MCLTAHRLNGFALHEEKIKIFEDVEVVFNFCLVCGGVVFYLICVRLKAGIWELVCCL